MRMPTKRLFTDFSLVPRRRLILFLAILGALLTAAAASAWSTTYVTNRWLTPAEYYGTGSAPTINYNEVSWCCADSHDAIGTTLCNPDGTSCYVMHYRYTEWEVDFREISYGKAWCGGAYFNRWNQYVYYCYAKNF
jgi:hypothetical protein